VKYWIGSPTLNPDNLLVAGNVGAGEREGRVISSLVSRRHFR